MACTTGKTPLPLGENNRVNSRSNSGCINENILMMVREGGDTDYNNSTDDSNKESYEYDLPDDENEVDEAKKMLFNNDEDNNTSNHDKEVN